MGIDSNKIHVLYSAGTKIAYRINKRFYGDIHYVWCTDHYHLASQPVTSDPQTRCNRFLHVARTEDRHAIEIKNEKVGILKGAKAKLEAGVISKAQHDIICQMVNIAPYSDFTPVLYVISGKKVKNKCEAVDLKLRASNSSVEFLITELAKDDFQLIDFKEVFKDMIDISNKTAGE